MQLRNYTFLALATLTCAVSASAQQTINYDFSAGATAFATDFSNNGPSAGTNTWFGTGGVGALSGSAHINNNGTQPSLVYNTGIATSGIASFNTSVF
jgi:hypothetical protein